MAATGIADVYITDEPARRPAAEIDYLHEKLALQDIARQMVEHPDQVLPRLVALAMETCAAASAGLSLYEPVEGTPGVFRWHHLVGVLERFNGTTTPRDNSPCGVCLDVDQATLARHPERIYDWIADAGIVVPEVLLVPLGIGRGPAIGTLWIVARDGQQFDAGHAQVASDLAAFAGLAFRMVESERHLTLALDHQLALTREMAHRVQNLFTIANALVAASERSAQTPKEMGEILSGRLTALARAHAIVRKPFVGTVSAAQAYDLKELIEAILKPYDTGANVLVAGSPVELSERSVVSVSLTLHELATNAVKYGALSDGAGVVTVSWSAGGDKLALTWQETRGPAIEVHPSHAGSGSRLVRSSIEQLGGAVTYHWDARGLTVDIALPLSKLQ